MMEASKSFRGKTSQRFRTSLTYFII